MPDFSSVQAFIIDMDGVLWHGSRAQDGLCYFFNTLRARKIPFLLATNNASQTASQYVDKLSTMGVTVSESEILTSATATAVYLAKHYDASLTRVFVIGSEGAKQPLLERGFVLTELYDTRVDLVVCGLDRDLTWDKLATACFAIQAGARLIATNPDTSLPTESGLAPGNGAVLAAIYAATGVKAFVIGKPEPIIYQQALEKLGSDPARTVAIGDRLDTDILGAVRAGIPSLMVLSGVSSRDDLAGLEYQPDWVCQDIIEIADSLQHDS